MDNDALAQRIACTVVISCALCCYTAGCIARTNDLLPNAMQRHSTRKLQKLKELKAVWRQQGRLPREWMTMQCRTPSWYDNVLLKSRTDELWILHFRLPKTAIDQLCIELQGDLAPEALQIREPIPVLKRICIAIFKLASTCEYRTVATTFGISITSVHRCLYRFCTAMAKRKHNFIKWYSRAEAIEVADTTRQKYCYPQAIGTIDGTHIAITPPADGYTDYICRKMYPSIVLQAVTDVNYKFRDIYANTPGSVHDASVYHHSPLSNSLEACMPVRDIDINGHTIPLHILGGPAYPFSTQIMKGFTGRNLTSQQENFNVYHSSARICVEIAFGRLKSRWKILKKRLDVSHEFAPEVITTCCILHNMCEDFKIATPRDETVNQTDANVQPAQPADQTVNHAANEVRVAFAQHLADSYPMRRPFHL